MLGGIIFGHLSDRFGLIRVLTFTILMFSLFTGLCAVAQGYWDLLAYRAAQKNGICPLSHHVPPHDDLPFSADSRRCLPDPGS
ncbi:putative MFS transporter [Erwinia pyrifoliae DSM 12163]|nr:MFS transporter [Erwinia pyrifoliae]MCA8875247.1 MFS transporter [Erwinia pyrifoliae]CAX57458.1 Major facilitator superfamily MFS_1, fragment [Erwinia pyrifoliae Ep1/96]CAY76342.1 putative MFS transporter [Erwinia pyrifoliae DSM 12163]